MEYHKEYSKKNGTQRNIEKFGIWNIPGIFQKNGKTTKIWENLEDRLFHEYFWNIQKNRKQLWRRKV